METAEKLKMSLDSATMAPIMTPMELPLDLRCDHWRGTQSSEAWATVVGASFGEPRTAEEFEAKYRTDASFDPNGFFLVYSGEVPIGTCFAWMHNGENRVHWLAVVPSQRRRGIARFLLRQVVMYFVGRGISPINLTTENFRLDAIRLYLAGGFKPLNASDTAWAKVFSALFFKDDATEAVDSSPPG
jgi:GNAT superfamily N-acetyltransferase